MEETVQQILTTIATGLVTLLGALALLLIRKATSRIQAEITKIENERLRTAITAATFRVQDLAIKAVTSTEQTLAAEIREAVKDGKIDREELKALGPAVVEQVYGQLTDDVKATLELEIKDVKQYITDTVESTLLGIKNKL